METAHREERVSSSDPGPLASAGCTAREVTTCELQFTRSRSSQILPKEAENPGVLATNPLIPFSVVRQLFKVASFLVTAEDTYQPAEGRELYLSFPICKTRRLHCGALGELTFHGYNFQNTPLLWAEQELLVATEWQSNPLEAFGGLALEGELGAHSLPESEPLPT